MPLDQVQNEKNMSFLDHVDDLRKHLVRIALYIAVGTILCGTNVSFVTNNIIFGPSNVDFITYRILCKFSYWANGNDALCVKEIPFTSQNTEFFGQITSAFKIAFVGGIIFSFPLILFELWRFVKPALKKEELQKTKSIMFFGSLLFFFGVCFGYFILCPISINFAANFSLSEKIRNDFNLNSIISIVTNMTIITGIIFELPLIIYFLAKVGLVSSAFLRKYRRYAILIILIVAAIATPPDVLSQIILTLPLILLYESGIIIAGRIEKKQKLTNE